MTRKPPDRRPDAARLRLRVLRNTFSPVAVEGLAREVLTHLSVKSGDARSAPRATILTLCRALRAPHPYSAQMQIDQLLSSGLSLDTIFRKYLAAAAVELGRQWENSDASFAEVAVALARIHAILDDLRLRFPGPSVARWRRIAFAAVPGEQHRLGVDMATDLFRREGWDVTHLVETDHDSLVTQLDDADFVLVGLSAATRASMAALVRLILALRARRPDLRILVSGNIAVERGQVLETMGVDAVVTDVPEALAAVTDLVGPSE
ncbi:MAG: cobalamin B12-binding domain-containing protein [Proteobacteria bacterium]|nr:cobalamin B12-binding domain-containing protein [Pseudomonadota bacterium]